MRTDSCMGWKRKWETYNRTHWTWGFHGRMDGQLHACIVAKMRLQFYKRSSNQQQFHKHNSKWIQSMTYVIRSNRKIKIKNEITPVCMYICMYSTYQLYRHEDWLSTCTSTKKNTATAEDPAARIEAGSEKAGYIQASHSKQNKCQSPSRAAQTF